MSSESVLAFAPASVGNVGIGFDILGHTVKAVGDRVRARRTAEKGIRIASITGSAAALPLEPEKNTAGMALVSMASALSLPFGIEIEIEKGIPLGSGLGGSAASAVAAVVAGNALLDAPLSKLELLKFAMHGEAVASGSVHVDNIAPSLFGGLVLTVGIDHPRTKQIPVPPSIRCVLAHPHMFLSTREARRVLRKTVDLSDFVWQTANLAGFLSACYTNDLAMLRDAFEDVIIEPQRATLIPGFKAVKQAAMGNGALGCSISGAGPTVFAWAEEPYAEGVRVAMVEAFAEHDLATDSWVSAIDTEGARILEQ
ncbi:MAG: homoserine kinase [Steroidobacteraceae bacterium]|jgi:homoserine kinase|nr:homoserine kinase [Steroidobacteraceae bacterium]